jgi:hypothetical protein
MCHIIGSRAGLQEIQAHGVMPTQRLAYAYFIALLSLKVLKFRENNQQNSADVLKIGLNASRCKDALL